MEAAKGERAALMTLKKIADVHFPTRWADFRMLAFEGVHDSGNAQGVETALALILGDIYRTPPLVRIHSQCTTGGGLPLSAV